MRQFQVVSYLDLLTKLIWNLMSASWSQVTLLYISVLAVKTQPCKVTVSLCTNPLAQPGNCGNMFTQPWGSFTLLTSLPNCSFICSTDHSTQEGRSIVYMLRSLPEFYSSARAGVSNKFTKVLRTPQTRKDPIPGTEDLNWWKKPFLSFLCCTYYT